MQALRRHLRLFVLYFSQYAKARLEYRLDFFSSVFASFLGTAAAFGFLLIVFSRVPAVRGWTFEEMVFLYGFSLIPLGIFNVLSWNLYLFSDRYLIEGRFDRVLVRPVNSVFQVLFEAFRLEDAPVGGDHQGAVGNRGERGARGTSRTDDDRGLGHRSLRQHYLGQVRGSPAR